MADVGQGIFVMPLRGDQVGPVASVAIAPSEVGEVGDLARAIAEAQDVVEEEVLQLVRADGLLAVLLRSVAGKVTWIIDEPAARLLA